MSAKIKLASALPGHHAINGLDDLAQQLTERWEASEQGNPAAMLVIGIVRVREFKAVNGKDGRVKVPTIEVSRIEPLGMLGADGIPGLDLATPAHHKVLLDAAEARTGDTPLPIDAESVDDARIEIIGAGKTGARR